MPLPARYLVQRRKRRADPFAPTWGPWRTIARHDFRGAAAAQARELFGPSTEVRVTYRGHVLDRWD